MGQCMYTTHTLQRLFCKIDIWKAIMRVSIQPWVAHYGQLVSLRHFSEWHTNRLLARQ